VLAYMKRPPGLSAQLTWRVAKCAAPGESAQVTINQKNNIIERLVILMEIILTVTVNQLYHAVYTSKHVRRNFVKNPF